MFKKSPKNCFKPVLHSSAPVGAATIDDIQNKTCNGPILSYFNHFLLPQVDLLRGTDGEYIPLEMAAATAAAVVVDATDQDNDNDNDRDRVYVSSSIYSHLCDIKEQIEKYQTAWDNIKKFTNPYEYIHTNVAGNKTNISKLRPLSRSFYKMIEILKNNNILAQYSNTVVARPDYKMGINTFHLAEGPGGFIEALSYLRGADYQRVAAAAAVSTGATVCNTSGGGGGDFAESFGCSKVT